MQGGKKIPSGMVVNKEIPQEEEQQGPSRQCNDWPETSNYESNDEEGVDTNCKICKIPWIKLREKCGDWVQCDICDEYISQSAMTRCISANDIKVRFLFNCPLGCLIMQ